ncbi:hypothetical protein Tco_1356923, partial [Tanacetum coccineum]
MWSVAGRGARLGRSPMRIYARIGLGPLVTLFGLLGSGPRVWVTTIRHHVIPVWCIFFRVGNESSDNEESLGEDASKQGRINVIDADEEITMVSVQNVDEDMFDVNVLDGEEVFVAKQEVVVKDVNNVVSTAGDATTVSVATTTTATITTVDDITLAQALMEIKNALKLQAEFDEEEILTREKAEKGKEANIALIETWDDIHAKIDADRQLSERLQAQEQEELSVEENATLFQQLLEKRIKHFAAKRAEEKRNKPQTKAQQRKIMCTY